MGNYFKGEQEVKKYNLTKMSQKRFDEAFLYVYVIGKYNKLMDILIGERKDIDDFDGEHIFLSPKTHCKPKEEDNLMKNEQEEEDMNQNLLIVDNQINEIEKKEKINKNLNFAEHLNNFLEYKDEINSKEDYVKKNSIFNWYFHFFCKEGYSIENIENIKNIINDNIDTKRNNIFLLFVDSISEIYTVIDIFKTINKEFHPLFLFIMNNIENDEKNNTIINDLKNYIETNKIKMFNLRNVTIKNLINFEINSNEQIIKSYILDIYLYFINSWFYYNNLGDDYAFKEFINKDYLNFLLNDLTEQNQIKQENENKGKGLFNILMIGRPGVGKSTLVNLLSESKRSMEGKGINVTKYISRYEIKKYNISLYDSPGFEFDSDIEQVKILIEELNEHLNKKRNQIHLIFYLLSSQGGRDFYETEKEILKVLMKNKIQTIFLLTFCPDKEFGEEVKEVVERDLKKIFYQLDQVNGLKYLENKTKVFPVHLLDEINGGCKNFGLKTVFEEVYNRFKKYIIDEEDINKLKEYLKREDDNIIVNYDESENEDLNYLTKKKIFNILNKNENILYQYIKNIDDIIIHAKTESLSSITYYSIGCSFLGILGILSTPVLKALKKSLFLKVAENFNKVVNDTEKENLVEINSEKINEDNLEMNIPLYSTYGNYINIQNFGNDYVNKYSKELSEEGINGIAKYLIDLINCYNNSIQGLRGLGKLFND